MPNFLKVLSHATVCALLMLIAGCASSGSESVVQPAKPSLIFPPETALKSGDYAGFLKQNEEDLKSCKEPEQCATALFNLSFIHSYSKSPYYNPSKGLLYLEDLIKGSPESPWGYQARVWVDLMKKGAKPAETRKRPAREEPRSREMGSTEPVKQAEPQQQDDNREADLQRMREEIRFRDQTINDLNRQIQRSRQIDIEIEKKERGLLY